MTGDPSPIVTCVASRARAADPENLSGPVTSGAVPTLQIDGTILRM